MWEPTAWPHFEVDPRQAAAVFSAAGLNWMSQRFGTVDPARARAGSSRLVDTFAAGAAGLPGVVSACRPPQTPAHARRRC